MPRLAAGVKARVRAVRTKSPAFPVGLYGMLLAALAWLTLPAMFAPVERALVGAAGTVARAWTAVLAEPARASSPSWRSRLQPVVDDFTARMRAHELAGAPPAWTAPLEPVPCAVVALGRRGGGGEPAELRLDRTNAELADCVAVVTKGDALVGTLQRAGAGLALADGPDALARVALCNHAQARPVHAEVAADDGGLLRFVVRAAAAVDPAPLRVELWDDPYRAARLDRPGQPVRTRAVNATSSPVPADLLLGTTRIWGYARTGGGDALTLGVYVAPAVAVRAVSTVVAWRPRRDVAAATAGGEAPVATAVRTARLHELPGAAHGRWLLVGADAIDDGAAVVDDGCLLGTARASSFGVAVATSFAASRQRWRLVLLPDDAGAAPVELVGEVVGVDRDRATVRRLESGGDAHGAIDRAGHLFTGTNGPHCPAGLWIGRAVPSARDLAELEVALPVRHGSRAVEVHRGRIVP
jgi:hypothetical protein